KKKIVNGRLAQFLLPIGTVTNVPATAIYIALASMFIVQTFHPNLLSFTSSILICLSSTIATLASSPIPAATPIAVQGVVLQVIGIPTADIGLIVAIDWFV
ncbi:sodium:dicarboxylate symporter, partial [Paramuricea clavata]